MQWNLWSSTSTFEALPEDIEISIKTYATMVEFFANRIRVMHRCCHFWSSNDWRIRRHFWQTYISADFKCASKIVSYLKFCLYRVHYALQKDLEIPGGLALMQPLQISALKTQWPMNDDLTVVIATDDERRSGRWLLLFGNCTFNIESIPICDGGTPIHVTKAALDSIEVAVHHDDISGVPNLDTKQPESSWHRVSAATCQL
jgi:hypothetical protein